MRSLLVLLSVFLSVTLVLTETNAARQLRGDPVGQDFENVGNDVKKAFEDLGNDIENGFKVIGDGFKNTFDPSP